ncbi:FKBP-type peptidyl-prolyl cis-trans isomerase [Rubrivirga sp. IMCC43871]|uniref:FKBP-type peptidyl-prolyl cis-trans isomerase n=1 Tax=Rubrivirga sp. IMCC43871 TaxID=3391575 RepID=UPI00398FD689
MPRFLLLALAVAVVGCADSGSAGGGDVDTDDLDAFQTFSYSAGFQSGEQFAAQDSSFDFSRFLDGFNAGLAGDSVEIAYALGLQFGLQVNADSTGPLSTLDRDLFLAGVRQALAGDSSRISEDAFLVAQAAVEDSLMLRNLRREAGTNPQARQQLDLIAANAVRADSFFTAVRARDGVRELGSNGVLYINTTTGSGASPQRGDRVAVNYQGRYPNGDVFDESGEEPAVLPVNNLVEGFRDALLDMRVGGSRTVFIPASQAYGILGQPRQDGTGIPPNTPLEFDIELVEILDGQVQQLPPGFGPPPQ